MPTNTLTRLLRNGLPHTRSVKFALKAEDREAHILCRRSYRPVRPLTSTQNRVQAEQSTATPHQAAKRLRAAVKRNKEGTSALSPNLAAGLAPLARESFSYCKLKVKKDYRNTRLLLQGCLKRLNTKAVWVRLLQKTLPHKTVLTKQMTGMPNWNSHSHTSGPNTDLRRRLFQPHLSHGRLQQHTTVLARESPINLSSFLFAVTTPGLPIARSPGGKCCCRAGKPPSICIV